MANKDIVLLALQEAHSTLTTNNSILGDGQRVIATGITGAVRNPTKIGDGSTGYNSLPFDDILRIETDANYDLTQTFLAVNSNEVEVKNIHASAIITILDGATNVDLDAQETAKFRRRLTVWELYKNNLASDVDANIVHRNTNITSSVSAHGIQQGSGNGFDADKLDGLEATDFLLVGAKAADSELLDGLEATDFLLVGAKAADSELLDGLDSLDILADTTVYTITTASDEVHALPDSNSTENQQVIKRRGDGAGLVTFTTVSSQTIDIEAASLLELSGESAIILIPKGGDWESVKTGGASGTVVGIAGETISAGELVFFFTDGKVMLGDNRELGKSILSGFATNDAVLDGAVTIQSSGSLDEFTGLTIGTQYFLGNTAELIVKGSITTSEYIVSVGVAISATELDISIGLPEPTVNQGSQLAIGDFLQAATSGDRSAEGLKQIAFDNAISTANYPILWEKIGHKYNAEHFAAGDTDLSSQALLFYPTPIPGAYNRSGIPDISVSGTTATLPTGFRNGTLFLVKSGTDQAVGTELFVRRTGASTVTYHSSEAGAIANTGAITVTGVGILTQEGIYLDDAGQQITGGGIDVYGGTTGPAGALKSTALANIATAGAGAMGQTSITFDSADSPDARTTNETRPKTSITFGYIKAEHITTSGEPISALRYDTEWVANSDWTNAKLLVNHDLNTSLAGLLVKFYIILDTVEDEDKVIEVDFSTDQATETGLMPYQRSLNQIVVQTGINGILITEDGIVSNTQGSGKDRSIISDAYFYKVVITKPNLVATYADTGFRKVYDITTATDETFTLPDASTQLTEYFIKRRGAGAGVVNFTTVSSQTINGNPASSWGLKGESDITLLPVGDKWEVKDMNGFTFHVQDQKASGTACGAFTAGAWRTRVLNTVVENSITGASLSSNQITLPAGTYRVIASAPAQKTDWHKIKLYNITDSTDDIIGINAYGAAGAENVQTDAKIINALVTIAGTKVFEIQHRCLTTKTINGFGVATSFGVIEIYTAVFIEKIA